jgi:hypothetical protein
VPVALITTNIRVAVSEQAVYDYSVRNYGAPEASGIPEGELLRANGEIQNYLTADDAGPLAIKVRNNRGVAGPLFNAGETAHMADVRDLVQVLFAVQSISVAVVLSLAVVMLAIWPRGAGNGDALAGRCSRAASWARRVSWWLLASIRPDRVHVLAFSNDFWQLDPRTDHLIQMFPEAFWQRITTLIVMSTLLEALLMLGASAAYIVLEPLAVRREDRVARPAIAGPEGHARPKLAAPSPRHYSARS